MAIQTENRMVGTFHFSVSHIAILNLCKNGYKQWKEKIGFQPRILLYVAHSSQNLVLLLDQVKENAVPIEFPAFLSHL